MLQGVERTVAPSPRCSRRRLLGSRRDGRQLLPPPLFPFFSSPEDIIAVHGTATESATLRSRSGGRRMSRDMLDYDRVS